MFEQDYKELMQEVRPDAALVEQMVEQSKKRKRLGLPKAMKVVAAVLCGLVVLAGGTVAVDAATDGAVRKLFGFHDSVGNGVYETEHVEREHEYKNHYSMTMYDEDGNKVMGLMSKKDTPVFMFRFAIENGEVGSGVFVELVQRELEPEDVYTWSVYSALNSDVIYLLEEYGYENGSAEYEAMVRSLEENWEQIDRSGELGEACALGVKYVIDDLKENRNIRVLPLQIVDKENLDERGKYTVRGISYVKVDLDEWMRETEENGTTEFIVKADGGVKKNYKVKVSSYSPFLYTYDPVE